jgi:sulfur carrier protein
VNQRRDPISVTVNGEARITHAQTLADLIAAEDFGETRIATAVNGIFVPVRTRGNRQLEAGDRIEILSARQGG